MCRKLYKDLWLLVTSLAHGRGAGRRVGKIYALRMQIEETFRGLKNGRWGFGLEYARSYHAERLENLLLIGTLAMFIVWLNGFLVKANKWTRHFQANTGPRRSALSTFFLGQRLLCNRMLRCTRLQIDDAFRQFSLSVEGQLKFVGIP